MAGKRKPREALPNEAVVERLRAASRGLRRPCPSTARTSTAPTPAAARSPYSDVDVAVASPAFGRDPVAEAVMLMEFFDDGEMIVEPRAYSREEYEAAAPGTFLRDEVIGRGLRIA
ncbi:MAG: hypothetical protein ACUVTQ_11430 [Desulfotomaculales bacterium]